MTSSNDLTQWSKEELIQEINRLQNKNEPLATKRNMTDHIKQKKQKKLAKENKGFDFTKHSARPIALKIAYLGWDYFGLMATDHDTVETVEYHIIKALVDSKLIPGFKECDWARCGRTDKGVSSYDQVLSFFIRSNLPIGTEGTTNWPIEDPTSVSLNTSTDHELPYLNMINRSLPDDIKVLAWAPTSGSFDARKSCKSRKYKYYFPIQGLDIQEMKKSASLFIGIHDFRNLCKMDDIRIMHSGFVREILESEIHLLSEDDSIHPQLDPSKSFAVFQIKGTGFLWHQVRCIMAVLLLIGQGLETNDTIHQLFDYEKIKGKPSYEMASELALVLVECEFRIPLEWVTNPVQNKISCHHLIEKWSQIVTEKTLIEGLIGHSFPDQLLFLKKTCRYKALLTLPQGQTLEQKKERLLNPVIKSGNDNMKIDTFEEISVMIEEKKMEE